MQPMASSVFSAASQRQVILNVQTATVSLSAWTVKNMLLNLTLMKRELLEPSASLGHRKMFKIELFYVRVSLYPLPNENKTTDTKTTILRPLSYMWCRCRGTLCNVCRRPAFRTAS
jgi:hypothetical protein